jgi:two-component system nitrate/nitrite response regulator NarL
MNSTSSVVLSEAISPMVGTSLGTFGRDQNPRHQASGMSGISMISSWHSIRLAIVDAEPLFREGVAKAIEANPGFSVVAMGANAADAIDIVRVHKPDIILVDRTIADCGAALLARLAQIHPKTKIVLTGAEDEAHITEALGAGAKGYVLKRVSGAELMRTLLAVQAGEEYIPPSLAARLLSIKKAHAKAPAKQHAVDTLNIREEEILLLLTRGMTNREIAAEIRLSKNTVTRYVSNLLQKLHVRNRVEAAVMATPPAREYA